MIVKAEPLPDQLPPDERLLTLEQVKQIVPKSTATIYRWIRRSQFPPNYRIGPGSVAWRQSEIREWIRQHVNISN